MSDVVNIIISVVFVFLVFSLIVSGINEGLSALFAIRSKVLWKTIDEFSRKVQTPNQILKFGDLLKFLVPKSKSDPRPEVTVASDVAELESARHSATEAPVSTALVATPNRLVTGLVFAKASPYDTARDKTRVKNVSAQSFSEAMLDLGVHKPVVDAAKAQLPQLPAGGGAAAAPVPATLQVATPVPDASPTIGETVDETVRQAKLFLQTILDAVQGTELEKPVRAAIAEAKGDLIVFRASIERWFDARMASLSAVYKMWSRWVMLGLGLIVAAVFNLNMITTVTQLSNDSALAELTAEQASAFIDKSGTTLTAFCSANAPAESEGASAQLAQCYSDVEDFVADARELPPPLEFNSWVWSDGELQLWGWQGYFLGVLLGGLAISLGAPFWFDTLRRIMSLKR